MSSIPKEWIHFKSQLNFSMHQFGSMVFPVLTVPFSTDYEVIVLVLCFSSCTRFDDGHWICLLSFCIGYDVTGLVYLGLLWDYLFISFGSHQYICNLIRYKFHIGGSQYTHLKMIRH